MILPARTRDKANTAVAAIHREVPNAQVVPEVLDLADLSSVRAFAGRILTRYPQPSLDLLINNAGVMAVPQRELTPDGYERQFATNYLGPFALTALLFSAVKPQPGSRIVIVSSSASNMGKIDFDNLQSERRYSPMWERTRSPNWPTPSSPSNSSAVLPPRIRPSSSPPRIPVTPSPTCKPAAPETCLSTTP